MGSSIINVLLTLFPGLGVPSTLCMPISAITSISDFRERLFGRLSLRDEHLVLTTISNKQLPLASSNPLSSLLSSTEDGFISLRLSASLCGGKGGFGSQLRAAGGRMSSKRKKNQGENNGSSRNLDGRRLRTVKEAKALAEYLAIKPHMEKNKRDQRRKRLEQIVELAQRKEDEIKSGSKGKVDGRWVEDKEEASERTRDAVLIAMKTGNFKDNLLGRTSDAFNSASGSGSSTREDEVSLNSISKTFIQQAELDTTKSKSRKFFGFDDEDAGFLSSDDDEHENRSVGNADEMEADVTVTESSRASASFAGIGVAGGRGKCKAIPRAKSANRAARNRKAN